MLLVACRPDVVFISPRSCPGRPKPTLTRATASISTARGCCSTRRAPSRRRVRAVCRGRLVDRGLWRTVPRRDRRRRTAHPFDELRHSEGNRRAVAGRLSRRGLVDGVAHPPADHLRPPGAAERRRRPGFFSSVRPRAAERRAPRRCCRSPTACGSRSRPRARPPASSSTRRRFDAGEHLGARRTHSRCRRRLVDRGRADRRSLTARRPAMPGRGLVGRRAGPETIARHGRPAGLRRFDAALGVGRLGLPAPRRRLRRRHRPHPRRGRARRPARGASPAGGRG